MDGEGPDSGEMWVKRIVPSLLLDLQVRPALAHRAERVRIGQESIEPPMYRMVSRTRRSTAQVTCDVWVGTLHASETWWRSGAGLTLGLQPHLLSFGG